MFWENQAFQELNEKLEESKKENGELKNKNEKVNEEFEVSIIF